MNFAQGEFYMIGAFVAVLAIAFASVALIGAAVEWLLIRPLRTDELTGMIATLGISVVIQNSFMMVFGASPRPMPAVVSGFVSLGSTVFSLSRLLVIAVAALVIGLFWLFMQRTRTGRAMRAVAQDQEAALIQGIDVERIYPLAFGISVGLAAVAGALMAPVFAVSPVVGMAPMLKAFIVVILGGLGSIPGALLGGLLLGLIESYGATFLGALVSDILQLALVIVILLVRPTGLLGRKEA